MRGNAQPWCMGRSGTVTNDMLEAPNKRLFLYIGLMEAASQLLGFIGANKLPGIGPGRN